MDNSGWICPKCSFVYSPTCMECRNCNVKERVPNINELTQLKDTVSDPGYQEKIISLGSNDIKVVAWTLLPKTTDELRKMATDELRKMTCQSLQDQA